MVCLLKGKYILLHKVKEKKEKINFFEHLNRSWRRKVISGFLTDLILCDNKSAKSHATVVDLFAKIVQLKSFLLKNILQTYLNW